jgi:hypothetical protein
MAAKKAPAKKMAAPKAPAKKVAAPAKTVSKKQNNSGPGTSNPLKSGEEYLKPQRFMSGGSDKRTPKNTSGDLASERATMRQAAQLNRGYREGFERDDIGFLTAVTYRDSNGKLKNTVLNRSDSYLERPYPASNYRFMGDVSKIKKKKKK